MKKEYWITGVVVLVLVAGWFYWFQWSPSQIRQDCNKTALDTASSHVHWTPDNDRTPNMGYDYNTLYTQCLREQGLK